MNVLIIIAAVILYVLIGIFVAGCVNEGDEHGSDKVFYTVVWPIIVVAYLVMLIGFRGARAIYRLGGKLGSKLEDIWPL